MVYSPGKKPGAIQFPLTDYIRLAMMGLVVLLTLLAFKIGGLLSSGKDKAPAPEGRQWAGEGVSVAQGQAGRQA
jgi:hypothetical protein